MARFTEKSARAAAQRLAVALGKPFGHYKRDADGKLQPVPGAWDVDYQPCYGGCYIAEISADTSTTGPFGLERFPLGQFCAICNAATTAVRISKQS